MLLLMFAVTTYLQQQYMSKIRRATMIRAAITTPITIPAISPSERPSASSGAGLTTRISRIVKPAAASNASILSYKNDRDLIFHPFIK